MKVYAVYSGSRYEGTELIGMYSQINKALDVAVSILNKQHGKWWRRREEANVVRVWQSTWKEIIVYEYDVL